MASRVFSPQALPIWTLLLHLMILVVKEEAAKVLGLLEEGKHQEIKVEVEGLVDVEEAMELVVEGEEVLVVMVEAVAMEVEAEAGMDRVVDVEEEGVKVL